MAGDNEQNTRFEYLYRDASNYKSWADLVFSGAITDELRLGSRWHSKAESSSSPIRSECRKPSYPIGRSIKMITAGTNFVALS